MATNLEGGTSDVLALARPNIKIVGLHVRRLKPIISLDLPRDGLGWDGAIPNLVMVGGINGSGKSALLGFIAAAFDHYGQYQPWTLEVADAWIDIQIILPDTETATVRFVVGDKEFLASNTKADDWFGYEVSRHPDGRTRSVKYHDEIKSESYGALLRAGLQDTNEGPGVVFFPSEGRGLATLEQQYKMPGKLTSSNEFIYRWQSPKEWKDSLVARLYGLRWEDLNAKEEGRLDEANGFELYSRAFSKFFDGRKQLKWHKAELVVETKSGTSHDLSDLSSGEKQVILFMGELLHRWRPGSLILIDEPELHLHESFQTKLWEALVDWQKERGGQVIVATQSDHLFGLSDPGTRVILGGRRS